VPFTLTPWTNYGLAVRTGSDPFTALRTVRSRIAASNKDQPLADVRTLEERIASATAQERFITVLLCVFAAVGLALAAIGIYGVMSYTVTQRTREMGIRAALGAASSDVIRLVVARGVRLAFIGVVIGALGSAALTHLISSQLYGVTATNPAVFASVSAFVTLVGLAACYLPARRAAGISPLIALRTE
jgi:ABC-type antimicrobial peptide transport system permease subunit